MKIYYASDLHLEYDKYTLPEINGDVLVLAGDIAPIANIDKSNSLYDKRISDNFFNFIESTKQFKHVLYVAGNHELYGSDIKDTNKLKELLKDTNITVLNNESIIIDDVQFIGGTGWTDFNQVDSLTMARAAGYINDYIEIKSNNNILDVYDVLEQHTDFCKVLKQSINDLTNIVISHHSPSHLTTNERFKDKHHMNGCYASDLHRFMEKVSYWIHGHQHFANIVDVANCKVISNTRGYPYELAKREFNLKYIEI